ncbi:MAG: transporter substrate-binding domain-containing protein, partial [Gammaproteobacteria bacterium]
MRLSRVLKTGLLALPLVLAGCGQSGEGEGQTQTNLKPPSETGVLKVATRNGSTTYYLDRHENPIGPEHSLIQDYAQARGWKVEWTMLDSTSAVLDTLAAGNTHLAAAGLTHLPSRDEKFARGPAHTEITEQLVCHRDTRPMPRKPDAIAGTEIVITAGSSYAETLNKLAETNAGIEFTEDENRTTEVLLSEVAEQDIGCTVADSNIVQVMRRHFP